MPDATAILVVCVCVCVLNMFWLATVWSTECARPHQLAASAAG